MGSGETEVLNEMGPAEVAQTVEGTTERTCIRPLCETGIVHQLAGGQAHGQAWSGSLVYTIRRSWGTAAPATASRRLRWIRSFITATG